MGWLWGSGKNEDSKDESGDPWRDLDPSLRDFLEKESPVKYQTAKPPPSPPSAREPSSQPGKSTSSKVAEATEASSSPTTPTLPAASLYPDGRYAHLWSTYRSQSEIEGATRSEQEKLSDVLQGYKERKAQIGRAAIENCSLEHTARFLKALGYLSTYDRPPELDEKIQMHADTLFHRMLDQERATEEAKAAGKPIPEFPPIVASLPDAALALSTQAPASSDTAASSPPQQVLLTPAQLSPKAQAQLAERLKGLSPAEREVEEKAVAMEIAAGQILAGQIGQLFEEQGKEKRERKARGEETFTDIVNGWFGW
ncbi:MAG: hypothetical protein LQ347_001569 [Umbilicaria vellea]|nr:MAG: hypothetical protein LQ347_001569 [Umbilicaria vellea]